MAVRSRQAEDRSSAPSSKGTEEAKCNLTQTSLDKPCPQGVALQGGLLLSVLSLCPVSPPGPAALSSGRFLLPDRIRAGAWPVLSESLMQLHS